ncbi:MAG: hypothetical protein ABR981_04940 [Candidatus Micrarchaeaceae archaeon]|jgi:hypothetical protein
MQLYILRLASLIVIALVYMLFDVFNKRNVPTVFAYATLAYAAILTALYLNFNLMLQSGAIALLVLGIGFVVYKIGQIGAADVIEFAALSMILPIQQMPILFSNLNQFSFPFIISLLINTGIVALVIVPIYYLPMAKRKLKKPITSFVEKRNVVLSVFLVAVYVFFIVFAYYVARLNYTGVLILLVMMISSALVMLFSIPITYSMVKYVGVEEFEEGDIIAINLMEQKDLKNIKSRIKNFDRLVTSNIIRSIKEKKIKEKFPLYKEAMPFALPIFIALIVSLLAGNLMLLILRV